MVLILSSATQAFCRPSCLDINNRVTCLSCCKLCPTRYFKNPPRDASPFKLWYNSVTMDKCNIHLDPLSGGVVLEKSQSVQISRFITKFAHNSEHAWSHFHSEKPLPGWVLKYIHSIAYIFYERVFGVKNGRLNKFTTDEIDTWTTTDAFTTSGDSDVFLCNQKITRAHVHHNWWWILIQFARPPGARKGINTHGWCAGLGRGGGWGMLRVIKLTGGNTRVFCK